MQRVYAEINVVLGESVRNYISVTYNTVDDDKKKRLDILSNNSTQGIIHQLFNEHYNENTRVSNIELQDAINAYLARRNSGGKRKTKKQHKQRKQQKKSKKYHK